MTTHRRTIPTDPLDAVIPAASVKPSRPTKGATTKHPPSTDAAPSHSTAHAMPLSVYLSLDELQEFQQLLWAVRRVIGKRLSMSDYARLSMKALRPRLRAIASTGKTITLDEAARLIGTQVSE